MHIATAAGVFYDVSADISQSQVIRSVGISSSTFVLTNAGRKYDGIFSPMDRVVVYLTRISRMLIFSGYLDSVPVFSTFPGSVSLRASCSLKRLQHFMWDPHTAEALKVNGPASADDANITDGGIAKRTIKLLNEVAGWPESQIHIGGVPTNWFDRMAKVADVLVTQAEVASMISAVGTGILGGQGPGNASASDIGVGIDNGIAKSAMTIPGIGIGTGQIPSGGYGGISHFGGPTGGAFGGMALTGEPGGLADNQRAQWGGPYFCAMRWGYSTIDRRGNIRPTPGAVSGAVAWWKNRKILVVNPRTKKAVCVRAADWGPALIESRLIDVSKTAMDALGTSTDDNVFVSFAPTGMALGPVSADYGKTATALAPTLKQALTSTPSGEPAVMSNGWVRDGSTITEVKVGKWSFQVAKQAAPRFAGFVTDLLASGYVPTVIGGYRANSIIITPGGKNTGVYDNHGYGAAIDIDPDVNGFFTGAGPFKHKFVDAVIRPMAHKWGLWWGGDYNDIKDYMHFEVVGAPATPAEAMEKIKGNISTPPVSGTPGVPGVPVDPAQMVGAAIFNAFQWLGNQNFGGDLLYGARALMNDVPIYPTIDDLMNAGLRQWCSAPNGDIIAWFPDFFGHWGTAAKMIIEDIEIEEAFTVSWSDDRLKTHMFVTSASSGVEGLGDATEVYRQATTAGIASVEIPELMSALFNVDIKNFADNGAEFLNRFGARTDTFPMDIITGPRAEFFFACFRFMQNWAEQYSERVSLTFMPELYPGMIAVFPRYGVQAYVGEVTHGIDMANGGGFTTQATLSAWSTIGDKPGIKGLPRGGKL